MMLSVSNISKSFGKKRVLNDVSLDFDHGVLGFIGPNGAGKSTLIKIILGLVKPDGGDVRILGKRMGDDRIGVIKNIGVLHEKCIYPSTVSGSEYLEFMSSYKGVARDELKSACEFAGVQDYIHRPIGSYSAGMLQRFGFADAIVGFPRLVILDEPTSNLDPLARRDILQKISTLHREHGMSFIISTHVLSEPGRVCTHVMILNAGVQLAYGPLAEYERKTGTSDLEEIFISILGGTR
jgi:ABC-2 type transport system ATP-binding protein